MAKSYWLMLLVGLAVVLGLPFAGHYARQIGADGCTVDGEKINPLFRVRIIEENGQTHSFCCIKCATLWLANRQPLVQKVLVTDERSGQELPSSAALYVRSTIITQPITGNRIHVFQNQADAERHIEQYGGTLLLDSERPFHKWE